MRNFSATEQQTLEELVDRNGLCNVLRALAAICSNKADYYEDLQKSSDAEEWRNDAERLENLATKVYS